MRERGSSESLDAVVYIFVRRLQALQRLALGEGEAELPRRDNAHILCVEEGEVHCRR